MKGIILSGGLGTRLRPITSVVSKQLLPVYDKPMIYYPLSILLSAGIKDIILVSNEHSLPMFKELFGNGSRIGVNMEYVLQPKPEGIAQSFILTEHLIKDDYVTLILGDNIFHTTSSLSDVLSLRNKCSLFGYQVSNPSQYGVAVFDKNGKLTEIQEKPSTPPSNIAITGLYMYDSTVVERAKALKPSKRGELEITDLSNSYISEGSAHLYTLNGAWLDMGSPEGLLQASNYVQTIQDRQGVKIGCLEEIAHINKMIGASELQSAYEFHKGTEYGEHIKKILYKHYEDTKKEYSKVIAIRGY